MNRDVLGYVAVFSLISIMGLFVAVVLFGVNNDYMISELNDFGIDAEASGLISSQVQVSIEASAQEYAQLINYFDWYWLLFYIVFIGSTVSVSYFSKDEDEFSFLGMLFYGTLLLLFLFSIMTVFTDWFSDLLYKLLPNLAGLLPKFDSWMNNAGIFTMIHLIFCILANKVNLNLDSSIKKKGVEFVDSNEVL